MALKVGDRVKVIKTTDNLYKKYIGKTAKVLSIDDSNLPYELDLPNIFGGETSWWKASELQLLKKKVGKPINHLEHDCTKLGCWSAPKKEKITQAEQAFLNAIGEPNNMEMLQDYRKEKVKPKVKIGKCEEKHEEIEFYIFAIKYGYIGGAVCSIPKHLILEALKGRLTKKEIKNL